MKKRRSSTFRKLISYIIILVNIFTIVTAQQQGNNNNETSVTRRLRIAVPVKDGFTEFVDIKRDPTTKERTFNGFSIDIFKAVINSAMADPTLYDFVPFEKSDGTMNGTYDDMLKAVSSGDYDGAVGDVSIRYYRTQWVDFTMPYSESGVSMMVPLRLKNAGPRPGARYGLTKLAKGLIGATVSICVICLLAALVPSFVDPGEGDAKLTRLVIVICFLVMVVIATCFTATVISLVTAQKPTPVIKQNMDDLIKKGKNVGYQKGSFVFNLLIQKGFLESQLKPFGNIQTLSELFSQGSENGGIDAAIDETAFLKLFLTQHCNAYALVPSAVLHGDGLGFAFKKGSTLIHDISVGILKVTNNDAQLSNITQQTIGNLDTCLADITGDSDILFDWEPTKFILIAGGISVVLLIIILSVGCYASHK